MESDKKKGLSSFSIILLFTCFLLVGLALVPLLPIKRSPSQELPQLSVSFSMNGISAKVVEKEVTSKLEAMLCRVQEVKYISSTSDNGYGRVYIEFNKHANINAARLEVSTIVRQLYPSLPDGVSYPFISMNRSEGEYRKPFLSYTINAPSSPIVIQEYAEKHIRPRLTQLEGIDEITLNGATPMIWKLEYDYVQLQRLQLTVNDIRTAIQEYLNKDFLGTGRMENGPSGQRWIRIALVPDGLPETFDPSKIAVRNQAGKIIRLDQLVRTSYEEEEPSSYFRINGLNSIYFSVLAKEGANQLNLGKKIKRTLEEMKGQFPPNYELHLAYDETEFIQEELQTIYLRSGLTVLILLCFVLLIYRSLSYLLLIAATMLCNLSIAVIFYYLFGLEIQLYSLMGITISLSLILDNIIVMSDQILVRKNKKAFLAILAATLTTMSALIIIFFLDERIRLNLQDFAYVILINLAVSLFATLFLVPALIEKLDLIKKKKPGIQNRKSRKWRFTRAFNRFYAWLIQILYKRRVWLILLLVLAFGLPVFLLPDAIDTEEGKELSKPALFYNKTLGSDFYKEKIKPVTDVVLGGTLRLFVQKVYEGSYWENQGETSLYVTLSMPNGSTLNQTDQLVRQMENNIRGYREIKTFQSNVNQLQANISIQFNKEYQKGAFPYQLKSELIGKAVELGGGSWGVFGLGDGFSNDLKENAGSYQIKMYGYDYETLYALAEQVKDTLLQHRRIKDVTIDSEFSWYKSDYQEFVFNLNKERLAGEDFQPMTLYNTINPMFGKNLEAGTWLTENGSEQIRLFSKQAEEYDIWALKNVPGLVNDKMYRLSELANIEKAQAPQKIARENQQYRLCLQYEYIGAYEQGKRVMEQNVDKFKKILPMGYSIQNEEYGWGNDKGKNSKYGLLLVIIIIIYFSTSILFNSLKQPLVILFVIPVSFIGLFLTFYGFELNFDQGGFAAFVLLCGLTVNAGIYVLNEYNNIRKSKKLSPMRAYLKAWNAKIIPISLTILSTILGFVPFLVGEKEGFWFPLATGTIGGLVMSFIGLFLFIPVFMGIGKTQKKA